MLGHRLGCCVLLSAVVVAAAPAAGAERQEAPQLAQAAPGGLEEIVVTARRREENLQTVPLTVSVVTGQVLKERSVSSPQELQYMVPSLNLQTVAGRSSNPGIIRGIRQGALTYFNEIRTTVSNTLAAPIPFFDLQNVQVLKGPQGTLFGGTAMSGAILYQPAQPTNRLEGYAEATFGNYSRHDLEGVVNIPLAEEKVLVRLGAQMLRRRGFVRDLTHDVWLDNSSSEHYRASVTLKPVEGLENRAVFGASHWDEKGPGYQTQAIRAGGPMTLVFPGFVDAFARQQALGRNAVAPGANVHSLFYAANYHFSDILSYEVTDTLTVKNIFGWGRVRRIDAYDADGTTFSGVDQMTTKPDGSPIRNDTKSEEFQLQGNMFDRTLKWTAGYYWLYLQPYGAVGQNVVNALGNTTATRNLVYSKDSAWFGHAEYDLLNVVDGLKIAAGYRRSRSRASSVTSTWRATVSPGTAAVRGVCTTAGADSQCQAATAVQSKGSGYTFSVEYSFDAERMVYFKTSKAYNPGGINANVPDLNSPFRQYSSESVTDYEVGMKADWRFAGMQARTNIDLYQQYYDNVVFGGSGLFNGVLVGYNFNAAKLRARGVEFEGTLVPADGVTLTAAYAYLMPMFTEVLTNTSNITMESKTPGAPRHKFVASATYQLPLDSRIGTVDLQASVTAQTRMSTAAVRDIIPYIQPVTRVSARIDWRDIMGYPIDLGLSATNLTNNRYYEGLITTGNALGYTPAFWSEPRMYRASLRYRFGDQ